MCIYGRKTCNICKHQWADVQIFDCILDPGTSTCTPIYINQTEETCDACTELKNLIKKYRKPEDDNDEEDDQDKDSPSSSKATKAGPEELRGHVPKLEDSKNGTRSSGYVPIAPKPVCKQDGTEVSVHKEVKPEKEQGEKV